MQHSVVVGGEVTDPVVTDRVHDCEVAGVEPRLHADAVRGDVAELTAPGHRPDQRDSGDSEQQPAAPFSWRNAPVLERRARLFPGCLRQLRGLGRTSPFCAVHTNFVALSGALAVLRGVWVGVSSYGCAGLLATGRGAARRRGPGGRSVDATGCRRRRGSRFG